MGEVLTLALAGNPNAGKTSIFNALTGSRQHVGNWPGKTVAKLEGTFRRRDIVGRVVDLPAAKGAQVRWLPAGHPSTSRQGPTLLIYSSYQLSLGSPRRSEPIALYDVEQERSRALAIMPAETSPDGAWLWRGGYGRFELRDREDRSVWAYHARSCAPQWRVLRPADMARATE